MRRGMTLLEVLLSLVLLGALSIAAAGLTRLAAGAGPDFASRARWLAAAGSTLDAIARDLATSDVDAMPDADRVRLTRSALWITTRAPSNDDDASGPVLHGYRLDRGAELLMRTEQAAPTGNQSSGRREHSRPLLGRVADWSLQLDSKAGVLSVAIRAIDGQKVERRMATR